MKLKSKTTIFIWGFIGFTFLVVGAYDIYAIMEGGTEATISFVVYELSYKYPIFTWTCGFVTGLLTAHFFWRTSDTKTTRKITEFVKGQKLDE